MIFADKLKAINIRVLPGKLFYGPEWIVLGVNNICNLHCKMCDVGTGFDDSNFYYHLMGSRPVNMPLELIKLIIDQTSVHFPDTKLGYAFTEPLIYPYLFESLEYAARNNLYTTVTTNGLGLDKKASDICKTGLNEIFISLDGPPEVHNQIRGHGRSFESAYAGIEQILSINSGKPRISVYCTITEWNAGRLAEFAGLFKDIPLKELGIMHTNYTNESMTKVHNQTFGEVYPAAPSSVAPVNFENMNLRELHEQIIRIKNTSYAFPVVFSPDIFTAEALHKFYFEPERFFGKRCNDAFRNLMIKSDGMVIPSHGRCYRVNAGNIHDRSLKEIWNSTPISDFRRVLMKEGGLLPACSRCCSAF